MPVNSYRVDEVIDLPQRDPYIHGLLYEEQLALMHGPGGRGKSYVSVAMAACLASGLALTGEHLKPAKEMPVLYMQTEGSRYDFGERIKPYFDRKGAKAAILRNLTFLDVAPINLANYQDASVKELSGIVKETKAKVLFVDSLYSSVKGSLTEDSTAMAIKATTKVLQFSNPGLAIVAIHHDHREKRNDKGQVIDEDAGSFFGSGFLYNMTDQVWKFARQYDEDNSHFKQTKHRSRFDKMRPGEFDIMFDYKSGAIVTQGKDADDKDTAVRRFIVGKGTMGKEVTPATVAPILEVDLRTATLKLQELENEGFVTNTGKGTYIWTPS